MVGSEVYIDPQSANLPRSCHVAREERAKSVRRGTGLGTGVLGDMTPC